VLRFFVGLTMAVPVAAAVVACGGRGAAVQQTASRSVSTASTSGVSSDQRCVQRWNEKLKRTGGAGLKKVPHIASYKVHVGTERNACLVIIFRTGRGAILFGALPGSSNYQFIPAKQGKRVKPSLLVPNAHFDPSLKLALG
jgi:hypothetical protein